MKILIVDDSATSRMLFRVYMPKDQQHELHEASNLTEALDKMMKTQPELIVLDYNMPDHTGVEMAIAMRQAGFNGTFALLTANTQQSVLNQAEAAGFAHIMEKPIHTVKITRLLESLSL